MKGVVLVGLSFVGSVLGGPCDFPVVDARYMDPEEFQKRFVDPQRPAILLNAMDHWEALDQWRWSNLKNAFEGIPLRVGPGPYPKISMSIDEYLEKAGKIFDEDKDEIPGVFQYGQVPTSWSLWAHKDKCVPAVSFMHPHSEPIHDNYTIACHLLSKIQVPRFLVGATDDPSPKNMITHSGFLIGFKNSGIDYHKHQPAVNVILHGAKEWFMKVPRKTVEGFSEFAEHEQSPVEEFFCSVYKNNPICSNQPKQQEIIENMKIELGTNEPEFPRWYKDPAEREANHIGAFAKTIKTNQVTEMLEDDTMVLHCIQKAGEIMFIPPDMQHAVRNMQHTVAMQMQWDDRWFGDREERHKLYRHLLHDLDPEEPDPDFVKIPFDFRSEFHKRRLVDDAYDRDSLL